MAREHFAQVSPAPEENHARARLPPRPARFHLPVIGEKGPVSETAQEVLGKPLSKEVVDAILAANPRPTVRSQCEGSPRPCPFVSCRHHLMIDVHQTSGSLHINHRSIEEMRETCSLDVADRAALAAKDLSLDELGVLIGVSNERVRQVTLEAAPAFAALGARR